MWRGTLVRLRGMFRPAATQRELDDELRFHLEAEVERLIAGGVDPDEARHAARRSFGNVGEINDAVRDIWTWPFLSVGGDIRHASRALSASPWFTGIAILSLAIAVCVASGVVSVLDASHGRNTPFRNIDRAVVLYRPDAELDQGKFGALPPAVLERVSRESRTLRSLALFDQDEVNARTEDWSSIALVANVSSALPRVIGVRASLGRTFVDADDAPGAPPSAMLAYSYWRTRFAGDSGVVGRSIVLDGTPHLVLGVLEPRAQLPSHADLWRLRPLREMLGDTTAYLSAVALLSPGANAKSATAELAALGAIASVGGNRSRRVRTLGAAAFPDYLSNESKSALMLLGMIGIVVGLIAATNFAALVLARGIRRRSEIAIRAALGASVGRLVVFMIAECLLVALAGGLLGGLLAPFVVQALGASVAYLLPPWMQLTFSPAAVVSAIGLAVIVGIVFGLAPAIELARPAALGVMKGNALATQRQRSGRQLLVAVQVALATGPIVFATMFFGGLFHFGSPSLGFDQRNLYEGTVQESGPDAKWRAPEARAALLNAVRADPNVVSAAISQVRFVTAGEVRATSASGPTTLSDRFLVQNEVTPEFFSTYTPMLVAGRLPTDAEIARGEPVAVVNESALRALSLGRVVGWRLRLRGDFDATVVGIVGDVRQTGFERSPIAQLYSPLAATARLNGWSETLWVRARPGATHVVSGIYSAIRFNASMAPLADLKSSVEVTETATRELRSFVGIVLTIFGVAVLLAAMGIYGTIAYAAVMRRREVAVRLALGASRANVAGLVMREAAVQALIGLTVGVVGGDLAALSVPNGMNAISLPPLDVILLATVSFGLVLVIASFVPVRRVWATDCSATLREEG